MQSPVLNNNDIYLEKLFGTKDFYKNNQETAAYFQIRFVRQNHDLMRVFIDGHLNPEIIIQITDPKKVARMRAKREALNAKMKYENGPARSPDDFYHTKKLKTYSESPPRRKVFRKRRRIKSRTSTDNEQGKIKPSGGKRKGLIVLVQKNKKGGAKKTSQMKKSKDVNKNEKNKAGNKSILNNKNDMSKNNLDKLKNKLDKSKDKQVNFKTKSDEENKLKDKNLQTQKSKSMSKSVVKTDDKDTLPAFARPGQYILKEIDPKRRKPRVESQIYHGINMNTRCYKNIGGRNTCDKAPVFQHYLKAAKNLNGGPLGGHVKAREALYDGLCQELGGLEKEHEKRPREYKPRPEKTCDDCKRYVNMAEKIFVFKSSRQDEDRNMTRRAGGFRAL